MKLLIFLVTFGATMTAQTRVTVANVQSTAGAPRVWVVLPNGTLAEAEFDVSIMLDTSGARPVLRAVSRAESEIKTRYTVTTSIATFTASQGTVKDVYRNGLLMSEVIDYTTDGKTVNFVAAQTPKPGDIILLREVVTGVPTAQSR